MKHNKNYSNTEFTYFVNPLYSEYQRERLKNQALYDNHEKHHYHVFGNAQIKKEFSSNLLKTKLDNLPK
jgi:hypothetical protein